MLEDGTLLPMSTLAEIEAAVATLRPEEIARLQTFLQELCAQTAEEQRLQELYQRTGFHPFPKHSGRIVTNEMVQQLREAEDI